MKTEQIEAIIKAAKELIEQMDYCPNLRVAEYRDALAKALKAAEE